MFFEKKRKKEVNLRGEDDNRVSLEQLELERKKREEQKKLEKSVLIAQSHLRAKLALSEVKKRKRREWDEIVSKKNPKQNPLSKQEAHKLLVSFNLFFSERNKHADFDRLLLQATILFKSGYLPSSEREVSQWMISIKNFLSKVTKCLHKFLSEPKFHPLFTLSLKMLHFYTDSNTFASINSAKSRNEICGKIYSSLLKQGLFEELSRVFEKIVSSNSFSNFLIIISFL